MSTTSGRSSTKPVVRSPGTKISLSDFLSAPITVSRVRRSAFASALFISSAVSGALTSSRFDLPGSVVSVVAAQVRCGARKITVRLRNGVSLSFLILAARSLSSLRAPYIALVSFLACATRLVAFATSCLEKVPEGSRGRTSYVWELQFVPCFGSGKRDARAERPWRLQLGFRRRRTVTHYILTRGRAFRCVAGGSARLGANRLDIAALYVAGRVAVLDERVLLLLAKGSPPR